MVKENAKEIKIEVNCITAYPKHLVDADQYLDISDAITEYKKSNEWKSVEKPDYMYLEGSRFKDNEHLTRVIFGNIRLCINKSLFDDSHGDSRDPLNEQLMEDVFVQYLPSLLNTPEKLNEWIKATLLYSAGSDYWYKYEKEWY